MSGKSLLGIAAALVLVPFIQEKSRADFEAKLLRKFQQQNQAAADKLKQEVADTLARAESPATDPDQAQEQLHQCLLKLQEDSQLLREERTGLTRKVQDRLGEMKTAAEKKRQAVAKQTDPANVLATAGAAGVVPAALPPSAKASPPVKPPANPALGRPAVAQAGAAFQVTPAVSADRRFVRIGVNGTFTFPNLRAPLVPIQIPVPTVLYGPGKGKTVGPPERIFQVFLPQLAFTTIGLNTGGFVPDGGTAVLGGYQSVMEARNEFGVPVLSRIPYLSRLFRNVGYGRQASGFNIAVSPRVIILEEEEQKLLGQAPRP